MILYTIAKKIEECHGHGWYSSSNHIVPLGAYGDGDTPPIFIEKTNAQKWLEDNSKNIWNGVIVELTLYENIEISK